MTARAGVYVLGVGQSSFGRLPDGYDDLVAAAVSEAAADANVELKTLDGAWLASSELEDRRRGPGSLSDVLSLGEIPVGRTYGGPVSGGDAFRSAVLGLLSGQHETVLVVGAEKVSHRSDLDNLVRVPARARRRLFSAEISPVGVAGLFARRLLTGGNLTMAHLDAVLVKNRLHGIGNPKAWLRSRLTAEEIERAGPAADPLRIVDVAPPVDGAAALILGRRPSPSAGCDPVGLLGLGYTVVGGEVLPFFDGSMELTMRRGPRAACVRAYAQAGVKSPWAQLSLAEVDDSTSISELLAYEDLLLCDRGQAADIVEKGATALGGPLPVNPSGGNLSCGSAPAADILRRIGEVALQLRGRAEQRQIKDARVGAVHGSGGPGSVGFVAIFGREAPEGETA